MGFSGENEDSDHTKHAQEIFTRKKIVSMHPVVYFNNTPVNLTAAHKHFGMILDSKLSNENHLQSVFSKSKQDHWSFEKTSIYSSEKISSDNL